MGSPSSFVGYTSSPVHCSLQAVTMKCSIILLVTLACVAVQAQPTGSPPPPTTGDGATEPRPTGSLPPPTGSLPPPTGSPPPPTTGDGESEETEMNALPPVGGSRRRSRRLF